MQIIARVVKIVPHSFIDGLYDVRVLRYAPSQVLHFGASERIAAALSEMEGNVLMTIDANNRIITIEEVTI